MPPVERQTAHKIWIKQIHDANYVKQEGWLPSYADIDGKKVSRVHILATVIGKFTSEDGNYAAVTLDDGTDTIRSKAFGPDVKKLRDVKVGALVRFVGKVKRYNDETYLAPEVLRAGINPNWITVHKLELKKIIPRIAAEDAHKESPQETIADAVRHSKEEENPSAKLASLIKELDTGKGADINKIIKKSGLEESDAKNLLAGLLKSGDVFEPTKGKLKLLD